MIRLCSAHLQKGFHSLQVLSRTFQRTSTGGLFGNHTFWRVQSSSKAHRSAIANNSNNDVANLPRTPDQICTTQGVAEVVASSVALAAGAVLLLNGYLSAVDVDHELMSGRQGMFPILVLML